MGVSDKLWVKLTCLGCGASETSTCLDKGSMWSPPYWTELSFGEFSVSYTGGGSTEPEVRAASCKKCKGRATVETAYGFAQPDGF